MAKRKKRKKQHKITFKDILEELPEKNNLKFLDIPDWKKNVAFGFKYCKESGKYSIKNCEDFVDLFLLFKDSCKQNWENISKSKKHYHKAPQTKELKMAHKEIAKDFKEYPILYQLGGKTECRLIGFHNPDSIFEIILIDEKHKILKRK